MEEKNNGTHDNGENLHHPATYIEMALLSEMNKHRINNT